MPCSSQPGSFYPQLPIPWLRPDLSVILSWVGHWGPKARAASVPRNDEMSGQEFLISHLLQCRLGFEKNFFRSLLSFKLFLATLYLNPLAGGGGVYALCLDGGCRDLRQGLGRAWESSFCFHTCGLPPLPLSTPNSPQPTCCAYTPGVPLPLALRREE